MVYIKIMRIKLREQVKEEEDYNDARERKKKEQRSRVAMSSYFSYAEAKRIHRPPGKVNYQLPVANVAMINGEPGKIITDNKVNKVR